MKAKISKLKLLSAIVATCFVAPAFAQLGGLKNAAKNAASKSIESKPKEEKKEDKKSESSSSESEVKVNKGESGQDLYEKGNVAYNAKNYKEALSYYEAAQNNGYNDGEMRMKMNECKKYTEASAGTNTDTNSPEYKKQQALLEEANVLIEAGKMNDGMAKLQQAHDACPTCPDAAELKQLLGAKGTMDQMDAMKYSKPLVKDEGITSETHKNNLKQIVFSKTNISKAASSSQFTNNFTLGDDIIARIYLEKSIENERNATGVETYKGSFYFRITIDGDAPYTQNIALFSNKSSMDDADRYDDAPRDYDSELGVGSTTFRFAVSNKPDKFSKNLPYNFIYEWFWNKPVGNHKVKIEYVYDIPDDDVDPANEMNSYLHTTKFGPEKILATGEFTINVTEAGKIAAAKKVCPNITWLNNKLIKVPDGFTMINKDKKANETIIKVVELDNDWSYEKNVFGIILKRYINGAAIVQDNTTKLYHSEDIKFGQENISSGGSGYGSTYYYRTRGKDFCKECLTK